MAFLAFTLPVLAESSTQQSILVQPESPIIENTAPSTLLQPAIVADATSCPCCPAPCIRYKHHPRRLRACCLCAPPVQTVLQVQHPDPCICGLVEIPICLPACCMDLSCVKYRSNGRGRGIAIYQSCCGYRIKIIFRAGGDILVHTFG